MKPWSCQIELVRGCNLACGFCGTRTMPPGYDFMSLRTVIAIGRELQHAGYDPTRIELALRGEPMLHGEWATSLCVLRSYLPKSSIMMTTNGTKLSTWDVDYFWRAGGNVLLVDCYGKGTLERRMRTFTEAGFKPMDFYASDFNPWHRHGPKTRALILLDDIGRRSGEKKNRTLQNHAGNVDWAAAKMYGIKPLDKPLSKICVNPFRELVIHWDGSIHLCCMDYNAQQELWNISRGNVAMFWENHPVLNAARRMLAEGRRDFGLCRYCDFNGGGRKGLLPRYPVMTWTELIATRAIAEERFHER